jgi:hypothetical protein
VLGVGYAGVLHAAYGVPLPTATVAGAMCGFAGMLPDLDSDYGVPLRETMAFSAATIPMLLVGHFQSLELSRDTMVLTAVVLYLLVRFGVTGMIRKYTVHRGMFHSFPTMFIFGGIAFLLSGTSPFDVRCYKAGGVMGGFLSHLILDEIYAVEYKSGRWRFKKSFGTAMKFWGDDAWSNFSTYAKLVIVAMAVLGEPGVMKQFGAREPQIASHINEALNAIGSLGKDQPQLAKHLEDLRNMVGSLVANTNPQTTAGETISPPAPTDSQFPYDAPSGYVPFPAYSSMPPQIPTPAPPWNNQPREWQWPVAGQSHNASGQPPTFRNEIDTAQRQTPQYAQ